MSDVLARYDCRVHASNRHAALGTPVVVYATNTKQAAQRAIQIAWSGHESDARVTIIKVEQVDPK